jgi:hypothetical protein
MASSDSHRQTSARADDLEKGNLNAQTSMKTFCQHAAIRYHTAKKSMKMVEKAKVLFCRDRDDRFSIRAVYYFMGLAIRKRWNSTGGKNVQQSFSAESGISRCKKRLEFWSWCTKPPATQAGSKIALKET